MSMSSDTAPPPAPVAPLSRGKLVLLILAGVFAVLLGIVNAVLWNLSPQPVNTEDRKQAAAEESIDGAKVKMAALTAEQDLLDEKMKSQQAANEDLRAKIAELRQPQVVDAGLGERVRQLSAEVTNLETLHRQFLMKEAANEGGGRFNAKVLEFVTQRLCYLDAPTVGSQSGTVVNGQMVTVVPEEKAAALRHYPVTVNHWIEPYPDKYTIERVGSVSLQATGMSYLVKATFKGTSGSILNSKLIRGFVDDDCLLAVPVGTKLYCVSHQVINGELWENAVSVGVLSSTITYNNQQFYTCSIPYANGMAGAPVVTADGKLVGLMLGRPKGTEDLSLVVPVYVVQKEVQ